MSEIKNEEFRIERDTMGEIEVPKDARWGAQTQRSMENFLIGDRTMPMEVIYSFAIIKMAAALTNQELGKLDDVRCSAIVEAAREILEGEYDEDFPLVVFQTGSGTQSNMNVNEVIANVANEMLQSSEEDVLVHPNDHVNMSQSSNDTFPTAMHIAALMGLENRLLPEAEALVQVLADLEGKYMDIVKIGRTHFQDATPITLGQEISGWRSMIEHDIEMIISSEEGIKELALGGTAVGTGLNAPEGFSDLVSQCIAELTGLDFRSAENKFQSLTSKDALVFSHGALKALASDLFKIANDIRILSSGPRSGIGELIIPENEPGSSIMPGKVNPTQAEAVTMVSAQVMGNDVTIGIAASQGHMELNVFMPVLISNYLESLNLLADAMGSFRENCLLGLRPNVDRISENMERSLMLVTALSPHIGYEKAAEIAKHAHENGITLREASSQLGYVSEDEFDEIVDPLKMV